jgi:hypothetical protein
MSEKSLAKEHKVVRGKVKLQPLQPWGTICSSSSCVLLGTVCRRAVSVRNNMCLVGWRAERKAGPCCILTERQIGIALGVAACFQPLAADMHLIPAVNLRGAM